MENLNKAICVSEHMDKEMASLDSAAGTCFACFMLFVWPSGLSVFGKPRGHSGALVDLQTLDNRNMV
jgi:hypothetical protein